ncbi:hypothetical protein AAXE64_07675 [Priestia megaterium]
MKRLGHVTYELSEQEFKEIEQAVLDVGYWMDNGDYEEDAVKGMEILNKYFGG